MLVLAYLLTLATGFAAGFAAWHWRERRGSGSPGAHESRTFRHPCPECEGECGGHE